MSRLHVTGFSGSSCRAARPAATVRVPAGSINVRSSYFHHLRLMRVSASLEEASVHPVPQGTLHSLHKSVEEAGVARHTTQGTRRLNYHHRSLPEEGYAFFMPPLTYIGEGALKAAGNKIASLGFKKTLVVTDKMLVKVGAVKPLLDMLDSIGVGFAIYDEVEPNPTVDQVNAGLKKLQHERCDFLLSFGGGSPHDCCKAIGVLATNGGDIRDYTGVDQCRVPMLPMVAVNTTAGTAAEMTRVAVIADTQRHVKMALVDWRIMPLLAVDDPLLMASMPPSLTAATGMDALTHAMEAYMSSGSFPITDACALHAIHLIHEYLRESVHTGSKQARDMMSYAQYLAGMAFNSAGLGLVHALAHQLGGLYNLPHGVCNAVLLPVVMEYNAQVTKELFVDVAEAMGNKNIADQDHAVEFVVKAIRQLSQDVGIPLNLKMLKVRPEDFPILAENAMKDACGTTNPRAASKEDLEMLLRKAYEQ